MTSAATSRLSRCGWSGFHQALLEVRPVASSHSRNGAPKRAGDDTDRVVHVGHEVGAEVVAADDDHGTDERGPEQGGAAAVERAGDRPGEEGRRRRSARPRPRPGRPGRRRAASSSSVCRGGDARARRRCPRRARRHGPSGPARRPPAAARAAARDEQPDGRPVGTVEAAGQPLQHDLHVPLVGADEQVAHDREQRGADADADQHQPGARARRRPASAPAGPSAGRRSRPRRRPTHRAGPSMTIANTAAALAPMLTPMMSGLASGLRSMVWKIAPPTPKATPTRTPSDGTRQLALHQDVAGARDVGPGDDPDDVGHVMMKSPQGHPAAKTAPSATTSASDHDGVRRAGRRRARRTTSRDVAWGRSSTARTRARDAVTALTAHPSVRDGSAAGRTVPRRRRS